ncbi:MAG: hypothetical protein NTZ09_11735 [Candidatus Hydrogenedentes bacterium]|nr:hypothetical protein [Candidatus Hydrogenedentota bacterium]
MNSISRYHRIAMELAEKGMGAQSAGKHEAARKAFLQALHSERQAASSAAKRPSAEPTRSVLLRSAATLALRCGEMREAERLIAVALSGNPPEDIAEELRDLLEEAHFSRHLQIRGRQLQPEEFQLSISGEDVGFGIASADAFLDRIDITRKMVYRTVERKMHLPFRDLGAPKKDVREAVSMYLSMPKAASFAVTVRVGGPTPQKSLPMEGAPPDAAEITADVIGCLDLYSKGDSPGLDLAIPQSDYRRNFSELARRLSPDGKRVKFVGFTRCVGTERREVRLTVPHAPEETGTGTGKKVDMVSVNGCLLYANKLGKKSRIQIQEQNGTTHVVHVPTGMMSDIVKPLWEDTVTVTGPRIGGVIELQDIKRADA